jgi:hypothetical protein
VLVANAAGSRPALRFDGTNDFMDFTTRLTTIRTVFWVVKETATTNGYRLLLGDPTLFHFHSGANRQIWDSNAHTNIHNGVTRLNGPAVNGTTTNRPTSPGVISVVTNGPVTAANFSADRTNGRHWQGDLAELIVYDVALSPTDRRAVEEYLAARYGITLSAP